MMPGASLTCPECGGTGRVEIETWRDGRALDPGWREIACPACGGADAGGLYRRSEPEMPVPVPAAGGVED